MTLHPLPPSCAGIAPPERFTYPFCYEPHPLCIAAAEEVRRYIHSHTEWQEELQRGKMFGVLVVRKNDEMGYFAAFSGTLDGKTQHPWFVPPVFDLMHPGCYFQEEEGRISAMNARISELRKRIVPSPLRQQMKVEVDAFRAMMQADKVQRDRLRSTLSPTELAEREAGMIRQSQFQKAELRRLQKHWKERIGEDERPLLAMQQEMEALQEERKQRSVRLQQWLFGQFSFLNAKGQRRSLPDIFHPFAPPGGAGECCAPRLLQAAFASRVEPLCMAEFWVGRSPRDEVRSEGHFYPACHSRCKPILSHMLQGLKVEDNPLASSREDMTLEVVHRDQEKAVILKPHGMLSVPGKEGLDNVQDTVKGMFPQATGPMIVHRLDMDTSGLMVVALTWDAYHRLQDEFLHHTVHKTYKALLERPMTVGECGEIRLPLRPDITDRPRQMVDHGHGKTAITHYRVTGNVDGHALVELSPITGRTHQLRVHCAHADGLNNPILGDRLYGHPGRRLMLHAFRLTIGDETFVSETHFEVE